MAFVLSILPWVYTAKYNNGNWEEKFQEKSHGNAEEEAKMAPEERKKLLHSRNSFPELPLVNYTTQYGLGCFEGLKAFPQPNGKLKLFRPDQNAKRMAQSMSGLYMPSFPPDNFVKAVKEIVHRNREMGFAPQFKEEWEKDHFIYAEAIYVRPFAYSEPAIGLGLSKAPWVVMISTPVSSYFKEGTRSAMTTKMVRANPGGTGWIKCNANYVLSTLAKREAESTGFMEAIFLDAKEHKYIEEGSSCNIFFMMKDGILVTPALGDTILPGITRKSVLTLAGDLGIKTEERKISIDEVLSNATECFVSGTAAGVTHITSISHQGKTVKFSEGERGEVCQKMLELVKGIQFGVKEDKHGWMFEV